MSLRALAPCLILLIFISACAQVAPTGTLEAGMHTPEIPETALASVVPTESLPTVTPISTEVLPTMEPISVEASAVQDTTQAAAVPRFRLQTGSLVALANFVAPEAGCNWLGVGGQAFDLNGNPLTMLVVEVGGTLQGSDVFHLALTGSSTVLGPGGFVITLADHGINSSDDLWIVLYDLGGTPLTSRIYFPTYADCTKNFILINFSERAINNEHQMMLPWIQK